MRNVNCMILIACLLAGFLCGRMGNRMYRYYDGTISFGPGENGYRLVTYYSDEQLTRRGSMLLRVVSKE